MQQQHQISPYEELIELMRTSSGHKAADILARIRSGSSVEVILQEKTSYEEIYQILQSRSQAESAEVFKRIRAGADVKTLLRKISEGDLLIQLMLTPETRFCYHFPFMDEMPAS